jgi:hypothetical protein
MSRTAARRDENRPYRKAAKKKLDGRVESLEDCECRWMQLQMQVVAMMM